MSKSSATSPVVSFIIPTLNSELILKQCLNAIKIQSFTDYEILIVDGGSKDNTLAIAKQYHCTIISNPLVTAEAAKAIGLKKAQGEYIALIDSDNILPDKNWLNSMLFPFQDSEIIGSEPLFFTYRPKAGFTERYSSLLGANDPYAYINGNYDRFSTLSQKWTNLKLKVIDKKEYLKINIDDNRNIPTIGANGTIFRKKFLIKFFKGNYLFDIDILAMAPKPLYFAKVKVGIIHTYCESSLSKFIRKQNRRLTDYYIYKNHRLYQWSATSRTIVFSLYSLLIFPSLYDTIRGYLKKPDKAWFFHPIACFLTWWIYFIVTLKYKLHLLKPLNRLQWQQ
ncbi:MAG: glycosyltransferase family 2 protein [Candidatus Shapirobacteria bacterium]